MKPIQVAVTKYQAEDGKVFDSEEDCIHHEKMLSGIRKTCPSCNGLGNDQGYGTGWVQTCGGCKGRGWVEKVVRWE